MANNRLGLSRREAATGFLSGLAAWAVGLGLSTFGASFVFGSDTLSSSAFFFYNAHFVPLSNVGGLSTASGNAVLEMMGSYGYAAALLPALVLVLAGAAVAWRSATDTPRDAALAGATVTVGYVVVSLLGAVALTGSFFGGLYRPNVLFAVPLAGFVFPVVFGSLGGLFGLGVGRLGARIRSALA
jgi:hypothetical protein